MCSWVGVKVDEGSLAVIWLLNCFNLCGFRVDGWMDYYAKLGFNLIDSLLEDKQNSKCGVVDRVHFGPIFNWFRLEIWCDLGFSLCVLLHV